LIRPKKRSAGELLIIDYWNSPQGMQNFFAAMPPPTKGDEHIQGKGSGALAEHPRAFRALALPAPYGRNDRWVGNRSRGPVGIPREFGREDPDGGETRKSINTSRR